MYLFISFSGGTKKCTNLDHKCDHYVTEEDKSQCQLKPDYMMQNCKRSCDFCGPGRWSYYNTFVPFDKTCMIWSISMTKRWGSHGAGVRAFTSPQWGMGSIPVSCHMWLQGFFFGFLVFLLLTSTHIQISITLDRRAPWKPPKVKAASSQISYIFFLI